MKDSLCLVFGASGYVGGNLVERLQREGVRIRAAARNRKVLEARDWTHVELVEADALDATVAELAGELKRGAPSVQTLVKQLVTEIDGMTHDARVADLIGEHVAAQCMTVEAIEGMSAFLNKRKPRWAA